MVNIENTDKYKGQRECQKIELFIEQCLTAFKERSDMISFSDLARRIDHVPDIGIIGKRKQKDEKDCRDSPCEHGNRVIAFNAHDGHALCRSERKEPDYIFDSSKDKKENKSDLQEHKQRALYKLMAKKLSQSHKHTAELHPIIGKNTMLIRSLFDRFHRALLRRYPRPPSPT